VKLRYIDFSFGAVTKGQEGKYLREFCFILEERENIQKINFTIYDNLQKQLINYSQNMEREREEGEREIYFLKNTICIF